MESSSFHEAQKESDDQQQTNHDETKKKVEEEEEIITFMESEVYSAAEKGEIDVFKERDSLESLLTPQKNTILHIYLTSKANEDPENDNFVERILEFCPALLMQVNTKEETPLHFAARYGHASIVWLLIEHAKKDRPDHHQQHINHAKEDHPDHYFKHHESRGEEAAKKMLRMASKEGDTALHEAVRFRHLNVVRILNHEDGHFQHNANKSGETPLYMAVERGYEEIAYEILERCNSPATGGPNDRNVLHAAAILMDQVMIEKILKELGEEMLKQPDKNGWTPLHCAAHAGNFNAVKTILEKGMGREAAYMKNSDGNTALHLATVSRDGKTMREIIKQCPDSSELVNKKGWNILHCAAQEGFVESLKKGKKVKTAMKEILQSRTSLSNLLNEKDAQGNTPLHHVAIKINVFTLRGLINEPRVDILAFNNENKNARDIVSSNTALGVRESFNKRLEENGVLPDMRTPPIKDMTKDGEMADAEFDSKTNLDKDVERRVDKYQDGNVIVAGLIATVTFAAGFTVPGGFVSEKGPLQGTPILGRKSAFQTFMVMDTIALVLSATSVMIHPIIKIFNVRRPFFLWSTVLSFFLTISAMVAMVVAFATGTYAMLGYSTVFSILTCVLALSFFFLFFLCIVCIYHKASPI